MKALANSVKCQLRWVLSRQGSGLMSVKGLNWWPGTHGGHGVGPTGQANPNLEMASLFLKIFSLHTFIQHIHTLLSFLFIKMSTLLLLLSDTYHFSYFSLDFFFFFRMEVHRTTTKGKRCIPISNKQRCFPKSTHPGSGQQHNVDIHWLVIMQKMRNQLLFKKVNAIARQAWKFFHFQEMDMMHGKYQYNIASLNLEAPFRDSTYK